ncbi:hypothetical protein L596_030470 [Steinernema carpocapsae]|uniref:Uncharacterized protein n=1 Tax=Steinernema carpocapsae TaxID=34508 RepID=A0A4U5LPG9_STECR|nr:hypothetical protein L596_030470 [Steinernema carpocapsae]
MINSWPNVSAAIRNKTLGKQTSSNSTRNLYSPRIFGGRPLALRIISLHGSSNPGFGSMRFHCPCEKTEVIAPVSSSRKASRSP